MTSLDLSIIMPCYNRAHDLQRVLQAYDRQTGHCCFELIAVDDASSDETYRLLTEFHPSNYKISVFHQERNTGPGQARNVGIQACRAPIIAFVGDDTLPAENFIQEHFEAHKTHPEINKAVLGQVLWPSDMPVNGLMKFIDGIGGRQFGFYYMKDGREYDYRHFYTSNISIKTEFLKTESQYFDSAFSLAAFEDVDLGYRLSKKGLRVLYQQHILNFHYHYHNIWTFSKRQYNSGLMGAILLHKHPELSFSPGFRPYFGRLVRLIKRPVQLLKPISNMEIQELEMLARRVASQNEWCTGELIERLYGSLLDYFFYSGFIEGYVASKFLRQRMHSAHADLYLYPAVERYITLSSKNIDFGIT